MEEVKTILVLVELDNGNVHQVLTSKERKKIALNFMTDDEDNKLVLSKRVEPFELEFND